MSLRLEKINKEIQRVLMDIVQHEIDDPAIGIFSITRVDTTADLQESRIYYSLLDESNYDKVADILKKMNSFIRISLAKNISMRVVPQLRFIKDDSIRYSVDIAAKIDEVMELDKKNKGEEPAAKKRKK